MFIRHLNNWRLNSEWACEEQCGCAASEVGWQVDHAREAVRWCVCRAVLLGGHLPSRCHQGNECTYVFTLLHVCICTYTYIRTLMRTYISAYRHVHVHVHTHVHTYIRKFTYFVKWGLVYTLHGHWISSHSLHHLCYSSLSYPILWLVLISSYLFFFHLFLLHHHLLLPLDFSHLNFSSYLSFFLGEGPGQSIRTATGMVTNSKTHTQRRWLKCHMHCRMQAMQTHYVDVKFNHLSISISCTSSKLILSECSFHSFSILSIIAYSCLSSLTAPFVTAKHCLSYLHRYLIHHLILFPSLICFSLRWI